MRASVSRLHVEYERLLREPAFALPQGLIAFLKQLYQALAPKFALRTSDMSTPSGIRASDFAIRVTFPNKKWVVEVTMDHVKGVFSEITDTQELSAVKDAIQLTEDAIGSVYGDWPSALTVIALNVWLSLEDGDRQARDILTRYASTALNLGAFDASDVTYGLKASVANTAAGWASDFVIERSVFPTAHLFVSVRTQYQPDGKYGELTSQAAHAEGMTIRLLKEIGLDTGYQSPNVEQ